MTKHFENLWEESENFIKQHSDYYDEISTEKIIKLIEKQLHFTFYNDNEAVALGEVLFLLTHLSLRYNVNVFSALQKAIQDNKSDLLEGLTE